MLSYIESLIKKSVKDNCELYDYPMLSSIHYHSCLIRELGSLKLDLPRGYDLIEFVTIKTLKV